MWRLFLSFTSKKTTSEGRSKGMRGEEKIISQENAGGDLTQIEALELWKKIKDSDTTVGSIEERNYYNLLFMKAMGAEKCFVPET